MPAIWRQCAGGEIPWRATRLHPGEVHSSVALVSVLENVQPPPDQEFIADGVQSKTVPVDPDKTVSSITPMAGAHGKASASVSQITLAHEVVKTGACCKDEPNE